VVCASSLQHGLVDPAATGHDADPGRLARAIQRQLNAHALSVTVVRDDKVVQDTISNNMKYNIDKCNKK
jgi:hypothetical protein